MAMNCDSHSTRLNWNLICPFHCWPRKFVAKQLSIRRTDGCMSCLLQTISSNQINGLWLLRACLLVAWQQNMPATKVVRSVTNLNGSLCSVKLTTIGSSSGLMKGMNSSEHGHISIYRLSIYRDSHYKDDIYNENSYTDTTASLYWNSSQVFHEEPSRLTLANNQLWIMSHLRTVY